MRKNAVKISCAVLALLASPAISHAEWQAIEQVKTYTITGNTAPELYMSIGERGPKAGTGQAIAHTTFRLTWKRDYQRQGDACVLASATPKLIITYTLPKPSNKLSPALQARWETFIAGIRRHEAVHGEITKAMVKEIEAMSIGFRLDNDPDCKKIYALLSPRLGEISARERQKNRDFDQVEMARDGNIQRLILAFVNGE